VRARHRYLLRTGACWAADHESRRASVAPVFLGHHVMTDLTLRADAVKVEAPSGVERSESLDRIEHGATIPIRDGRGGPHGNRRGHRSWLRRSSPRRLGMRPSCAVMRCSYAAPSLEFEVVMACTCQQRGRHPCIDAYRKAARDWSTLRRHIAPLVRQRCRMSGSDVQDRETIAAADRCAHNGA
jgi:hypothetical protein